MNTTQSLSRREEKLGVAALIVAIFAVLLWGQVAPLTTAFPVKRVAPTTKLETSAPDVRSTSLAAELAPQV